MRHPAVDAGGRCYGRLDLPPADPASVGELAGRIRDAVSAVDRRQEREKAVPWTLWTSPARRCRLVAEALGRHRIDDRLQELDFGVWEGLSWDEVPRAGLDAWAADPWVFAPPGGESGGALVERVRGFSAGLADGLHVVITHGGPLKVLLAGNDPDLLAAAPAPGTIMRLCHHPG